MPEPDAAHDAAASKNLAPTVSVPSRRIPFEGPKIVDVELRHGDLAAPVRYETAFAVRDRRTFLGADSQNMRHDAIVAQLPGQIDSGRRCRGIGHQQDLAAADGTALEQLGRLGQTYFEQAATARHDVGSERADEHRDRTHVVGQRRHDKGIRRKHDERGFAARAPFEQIE